MVEVVKLRKSTTFNKIKDGEFFLFLDGLYLKSTFYDEESTDYTNAYCFDVADNHYTFFEDNEEVEAVDVKIVVLRGERE